MIKSQTAGTTAKADRAAVWEDFIDIFYAPSHVFARRAQGNVWIPLLVVTFGIGALVFINSGILQPVFDAEFNRGMAAAMKRNPRITPEMVETIRQTGQRIALFAALVFVPVGIFLTGSVVWLAGKLFEAKQSYRAGLLVAAYAFVPRIVEAVVNGVQGLLLDPEQLSGRLRLTLGIGRFLDPDGTSPIVLALVGRLDLFTIWVTVLLAIGLSVTGGISRARAFLAAPLIWAAGAIPAVLQAMRQ